MIDNTLDALPEAGGELRLSVKSTNSFLCVSMQGNEPGIAPEVQARLSEPFSSTKPPSQGSGQSLDIARRVVQEHGGQLEVAPEPGRTEFRVFLPLT